MKIFPLFLPLLAFLGPCLASAEVRCGGNYAGEDLNFTRNPLNNVMFTRTKDETLTVYLDATRGDKIRLVMAEDIKDAEWEKLKSIRDKSEDLDTKDLISRLGSSKIIDLWMGWTPDNFIHFEGSQRNLKFTFSCKKE